MGRLYSLNCGPDGPPGGPLCQVLADFPQEEVLVDGLPVGFLPSVAVELLESVLEEEGHDGVGARSGGHRRRRSGSVVRGLTREPGGGQLVLVGGRELDYPLLVGGRASAERRDGGSCGRHFRQGCC